MTESRNAPTGNPGYALYQIARALTTSEEHPDSETRERARQKVAKWTQVLDGMLSGSIDVGSRTPLQHVPGWATPEVVTGGFATGSLLAGGPLREHEQALLTRLSPPPGSEPRRVLNGYYLTDEGLTQLQEMLLSGRYDVEVPEEGALLVVAWLVQGGYAEEARALLEELAPHFSALRFYPIPTESSREPTAEVFLQDVGSTLNALQRTRPNRRIRAQKEAVHIWIPLHDQIIALFLETVEGEAPTFLPGPDGSGRQIQGGWPCQQYPDGWSLRAQALLDRFNQERMHHRLCGRPEQARDETAQLRESLRRCVEDPTALSGGDVGRIRLSLAGFLTKYGTPGSERHKEFRARQIRATSAPPFTEVARVLTQRLSAYRRETGLDDIDAVCQPITAAEAAEWQIRAGAEVPEALRSKVERSMRAGVEELVERGVITSGETLARVLPQITAGLRAAGFSDEAPRRLYAAIYRAFRRRRSLLLLNLQSQIKLEELPWVAALDRHRRDTWSTRELARQALAEVAGLSIISFPHAILPNKLLQELRALARGAELDLPLVDEVAADIFMGQFSDKFLQAARRTAGLLEGTLYATYYGIDFRQVKQLPYGPDPFAALCAERAGVTSGGWDPAVNGMIIEQQQILTTQNLAVLFAALDLKTAYQHRFEELARRCFAWICRRQQMKIDQWHARLVMVKNTAYAWRQMIFYLSLLPEADDVQRFLSWAAEHMQQQRADFQARFRPALQGLVLAAAGRSPEDPSAGPSEARRFLGWSKTKHWLLAK